MRNYTLLTGIYIFLFMINISAQEQLKALLPNEINKWTVKEDKVFDPESLYDYINGGAELYISYGFSHVVSRTYSHPNSEDITVEIFDMLEPENAYGVFTQQREEEVDAPGQAAQVILGSIIFWKGPYFVSLMNQRETPQVKEAMHDLAYAIADNIQSEGNRPEVVRHLPEEQLDVTTIKYFKHYIWLNSYNFIHEDNIFDLNKDTDAVLAKYNAGGKQRPIVLLIKYPQSEKAMKAWDHVTTALELNANKSPHVFQHQENNYWGLTIRNDMIYGVFNLPDEEAARKKLTQLIQNKPKQ